MHLFIITCQTLLKTSYCWLTKFMFIIIFLESIEIFSYLLQTLSFESVFLFIPPLWLGIIYPTISKIFLQKNFFALTLNKIWFKLVWTINVIVFYVMFAQMFKKIRFSLFIFLLFCSNCLKVVLKSIWWPMILGCVDFMLSRLSLVNLVYLLPVELS